MNANNLYPLSVARRAVGPGWSQLVERAYTEMSDEAMILDVKEKYGALRISLLAGTNADWDLLDEIEDKSAQTCEWCGAPGKTVDYGWYKTMCPEHDLLWKQGKRWWDKPEPPVVTGKIVGLVLGGQNDSSSDC